MDPKCYNSVVIDKLSKFPCYIKYRSSIYTFERPFRMADPRQLPSIFNGTSLVLMDCLTENLVSMQFSDILMFHVDHENDTQQCEASLKKTLEEYNELFSQFTYIRGRRLHDLFFRSDFIESKQQRIRNLKILDKLELDDLEDYTAFLKDKPELVQKMKVLWAKLILEKYQDTIKSIDQEVESAEGDDIKAELSSIKDILSSIPKEVEQELASKNTCDEVMTYWPTLLLPRSKIFDFS